MAADERQAILIADLGFGDAGKGTIVDYLVRRHAAHLVVRYNGGPQAGHNVVTADGRQHTFAQFGSGTFVAGTRTHLSRFMLVDLIGMLSEAKHLHELGVVDVLARTTIDERALVITPFQRAANRLREMARGAGRHGSCGMGVGETVADALDCGDQAVGVGDLRSPAILEAKLHFWQRRKHDQLKNLVADLPRTDTVDRELDLLREPDAVGFCLRWYADFVTRARIIGDDEVRELLHTAGTILFEGAQGVLLDEWHGFHPYTTWSTTTYQNAEALLAEHGYEGRVVRVGVLRAYAIRHGPGPFVTEDSALTAALPDRHNVWNDWQGTFRTGWFDGVAARYALAVTGPVDSLAVTNLDRLKEVANWRICRSYHYTGPAASELPAHFDVDESMPGLIRGIKVRFPADLDYQARLTKLLEDCRPQLQEVEPDLAKYLALLQQEVGVAIGVVSRGPTAADKRPYTPD